MSKPSRTSLDNFDQVSPNSHGWARDQNTEAPAGAPAANRPNGIETDHDARILDEIEASLRAMIETSHCSEDPGRLGDVNQAAAEKLEWESQEEAESDEEQPPATTDPIGQHIERPDTHQIASDMETVRDAFRDPRTPPWLLARALDPEPIPEPVGEHWPQPRKRSRGGANKIFLRFGLAAMGAAIVAVIAIKDIPSAVMNTIGGSISDLSSNAAAVFNEGKASSLQARIDMAQKEQERAGEPGLRYAVASADPQARPITVRTESVGHADQRRDAVVPPWPAPEATRRSDPAAWQSSSPSQTPAQASVQTPVQAAPAASSPASNNAASSRSLNAEEIAMLRKMGDDYISNGDFVGARSVLERAADAGDASAAFAIASTFDPIVLARFKVRGLEPDIVKAEFWYERARALGSSEAPHRLQAMMASRTN